MVGWQRVSLQTVSGGVPLSCDHVDSDVVDAAVCRVSEYYSGPSVSCRPSGGVCGEFVG